MEHQLTLTLAGQIKASFTVVQKANDMYVQVGNFYIPVEKYLDALPFRWLLTHNGCFIRASGKMYIFWTSNKQVTSNQLDFLIGLMVQQNDEAPTFSNVETFPYEILV